MGQAMAIGANLDPKAAEKFNGLIKTLSGEDTRGRQQDPGEPKPPPTMPHDSRGGVKRGDPIPG